MSWPSHYPSVDEFECELVDTISINGCSKDGYFCCEQLVFYVTREYMAEVFRYCIHSVADSVKC